MPTDSRSGASRTAREEVQEILEQMGQGKPGAAPDLSAPKMAGPSEEDWQKKMCSVIHTGTQEKEWEIDRAIAAAHGEGAVPGSAERRRAQELNEERFQKFFSETVIELPPAEPKKRKIRRAAPKRPAHRLPPDEQAPGAPPFAPAPSREAVEEYRRAEDAQSVRAALAAQCASARLCAVLLGLLVLPSAWLQGVAEGLLPAAPVLDPLVEPLAALAVQGLLLLAGCALGHGTLRRGLVGLWLAPTRETLAALPALAALAQVVGYLLRLAAYEAGRTTLFAPAALLGLCLAAAGRRLYGRAALQNFEDISTATTHTAHLVRREDGPGRMPALLLARPSALLDDFLAKCFAPRPADRLAAWLGRVLALAALALGGWQVWLGLGVRALDAPAALLCLGLPLGDLLLEGVCAQMLRRSAQRSGCVLPGGQDWADVHEAGELLLEAGGLLPGESVTLHGVRTIAEKHAGRDAVYGIAVILAAFDTLCPAFLAVLKEKADHLPAPEQLTRLPGGYMAQVRGRRVLVGSRDLFSARGVTLPPPAWEQNYVREGQEALYVAVADKASCLFVLSYRGDAALEPLLHALHKDGVRFLVDSPDPLISEGLLCRCYHLPVGAFVLASAARREGLRAERQYRPHSSGCLRCGPDAASLGGGLLAGRRAWRAERLGCILAALAAVGGVCLAAALLWRGTPLPLGALWLYQAGCSCLTLGAVLVHPY